MRAKRTLLLVILVGVFLYPLSPTRAFLQTVGDFLSLGANTVREIQEAIGLVDEETRQVLEALQENINEILATLEETYQDNLNITIDSLDAVTRNKLLEVEGLINNVNEKLQEDIRLVGEEARAVIADASLQLRRISADLEQSLSNVIIVGGETVAFVLDKAVANALIIISVVLLGIGVLIFVYILFSRGLPANNFARILAFTFMIGYAAIFFGITFVPPVRVLVMTSTGIGLQQRLETIVSQPRIIELRPDLVLLGETDELEVWGSTLLPDGQVPTARIADQPVTLNASSNDLLVVNVSDLTGTTTSTNLTLEYTDHDPLTSVVRLVQPTPVPVPAELQITNLTVNPSSPVENRNAQATVTIRNNGGTDARNFIVRWRPLATHPGLSQSISALAAGQTTTLTFNHSYVIPGRVDSVATVDVNNSVAESNEGNNDRQLSLTIQPRPLRRAVVHIEFTRVSIHDDADTGDGEMRFNFTINGIAARFPTSGHRSASDGDDINMSVPFDVTLREDEDLTIFVRGTEDDSGLAGGDDDMGFVSKIFRFGSNWGEGSHSDRSNCPDGCFTLHYTISTTFID